MLLSTLLQGIEHTLAWPDMNPLVRTITQDSRSVGQGDVFVAVKGTQVDGHRYISSAIDQGAGSIICEQLPESPSRDIQYVQVPDTALALSLLASAYYGHPASRLRIVGVTGTNGKTSVVYFLYQLFRALKLRAGLISTIDIRINDEQSPSRLTTPDALTLHQVFHQMVEAGCEYCFMEVSSHAVHQQRVAGIPFVGAVFTNISHDHLDYHKTFLNYLLAKKGLFDMLLPSAFALVNLDDRNGPVMLQNTAARKKSFALRHPADYKARLREAHLGATQLEIDGQECWTRLTGTFNAYNLLAVWAVAMELGLDPQETLIALSNMHPVEGRFEVLRSADGLVGIVDYAHTPDALEQVLETVNTLHERKGRVFCIVGCGGDRDREKRPLMAAAAMRGADYVVLTSDNPRSEPPSDILIDMLSGVPVSDRHRVLMIEQRSEAIAQTVACAEAEDVILIAGKGHETYQEINGIRHPFDDRIYLEDAFSKRGRVETDIPLIHSARSSRY